MQISNVPLHSTINNLSNLHLLLIWDRGKISSQLKQVTFRTNGAKHSQLKISKCDHFHRSIRALNNHSILLEFKISMETGKQFSQMDFFLKALKI